MIHNLLKNKQIILASGSPRRKEIFSFIGLKAVQVSPDVDEAMFTTNPRELVKVHAENKARAVASQFDCDCVVVAADTIVFHNKIILGKPRSAEEAADYLRRLSGDSHHVYTGVAIACGNRVISDFIKTRVEFNELSFEEIDEYIKTKEPMDKAGAYGIQGYGSQFISKISGCYFNVMGFPVSLFYEMLQRLFWKKEEEEN